MDIWPRLSVVIPIRNEERFIARTLGYVQNQDYPADRVEILVIDGESTDRSVDIVNEIAVLDRRVQLLRNSRRLSSAARNIGARHAGGEILLYIDGHVHIENNDLFKNVARLMKEKEVSVLSRPAFLKTPDNGFFQNAVALARRSPLGHGLDSTVFTSEERYVNPESSGTFYRREIIEEVGFFDESFDAAEDFEFNYRLRRKGYQSYTSPKLQISYYPRDSLGKLWQQMKRYGKGRCQLVWKHPDAFSPGAAIPTVLVLGLPLLLLLSLLIPMALTVTIGIYGLYLAIILLTSVVIAARNGWIHLRSLPGIFLAIHWGVGWGFLAEMWRLIRSQQRAG
ncbi:MAG: glycosyltransferase [bacterium]